MLYDLIINNIPSNYIRYADLGSDKAERVINALEQAWIRGKAELSVPYWSDEVGNKFLNKLIYALSKANWVESFCIARYSSFKLRVDTLSNYMDMSAQLSYRKQSKIKKYTMRLVKDVQPSNLVKTPSGIKETGLDRPGFALAANKSFKLDTNMLLKYYEPILANCIKSMTKMAKRYPDILADEANYSDISNELLDYYLTHPNNSYNMERNISDQRGRAIYSGLRRVFNPVSNKDSRSLMIADEPIFVSINNEEQMSDIYLFIAELTGSKATTWIAKKLAGMAAYSNRTLPILNLDNEHDLKELHVNIWLERIYNKLDRLKLNGSVMWNIPIEQDAGASLLQFAGVLLNDKRLLERTNVIGKNNLRDPWNVNGVPRNAVKAILTPRLYGSAQSAKKLLKTKNITLEPQEMKTVSKEFKSGDLAIANMMKDFMINNSNIQTPIFEVTTWGETFTVEVNKFKAVGAELKAYNGYCSKHDRSRIFMIHKPIRIPDYDRFKAFFQTLPIHNLDGKTMDMVIEELISVYNKWAIAIHDAGLVLPGSGMRKSYVHKLEQLRKDRKQVVLNYRKSIGATTRKACLDWDKLMKQTEQLHGNTRFQESALK